MKKHKLVAAVILGRLGGFARAKALTKLERSAIARKGGLAKQRTWRQRRRARTS